MNAQQINHVFKEDAPFGDITTQAIFGGSKQKVKAEFLAKETMTVSGFETVRELVRLKFPRLRLSVTKKDGSSVKKGTVIARLQGPVADILVAERVCLNFLQRLSGIATLTAQFVRLAKKHRVLVMDTRKTTPGLRYEEKKAVRDGGGVNHRMNLSAQYLIKNNHIEAAGSVTKAILKVRQHQKKSQKKPKIEVEVRNLSEFQEALAMVPDIILLDNMSPVLIRKLVALRNKETTKKTVQLEISGGIHLKNIKKYLSLGVDRISIGALTHSARAVDISLRIKDSDG